MKKFSVFILAFLSAFSVQACVSRSDTLPQLVGYVMDTTQALLPNAQVRIGNVKMNTSWDGRFVFGACQWRPTARLVISCEGYKTQKISLRNIDPSRPLVVALVPKPHKTGAEKEDKISTLGMGKGAVLYSREAHVSSSAPEIMPEAVYTATETVDYVVMDIGVEAEPDGALIMNDVPSAGKLTAGEVNDFAKWHLWSSVIDNSHKQYIDTWHIAPRERFTVQVLTSAGMPVVNRSVALLDPAGNTLFQAMTDNTGKAELWYQLISRDNLCGKHANLRIRVDDQVVDAHSWAEGPNMVWLDEPCELSDEVEVMFVFDATGSMGDELHYLQAEMKDVIGRAKDATGGLVIRTGAVVYRDHGDEYLTRISQLTEDITVTQAFIDKQGASGGGDYPEAIPEALMAALNSAGWQESSRARIAFLILDAPCHEDSITQALLHDQIFNAAAIGVRVVPVVCSGLGEREELLMRSIALATNGTSFFLTDDSGIGNPHLKPTTDSLKVEHLNDMLVRTIVEFSTIPECGGMEEVEENEKIDPRFIPNPFEKSDLDRDESIPHGPATLYLMDVSGKLITVSEGDFDSLNTRESPFASLSLPAGIYFVKAFYEGEWHTKKIFMR